MVGTLIGALVVSWLFFIYAIEYKKQRMKLKHKMQITAHQNRIVQLEETVSSMYNGATIKQNQINNLLDEIKAFEEHQDALERGYLKLSSDFEDYKYQVENAYDDN